MSSTITQTTTANSTVLTLSGMMQQAEPLLDRLAEILWRFREYNDDLSQRLHEWGSAAILIEPDSGMDIKAFREVAKKQLDKLENEILINPLTSEPLQDPVFDDVWVWEKWMFEDYMKVSDQPIVMKTHEFAKEMINWLSTVREKTQIVSAYNEKKIVLRWASETNREVALFLYEQMIDKAITIQRLRSLKNQINAQESQLAQLSQEVKTRMETERKEIEIRAEQYEQKINNRFDSMIKAHHVAIEIQKSQNTDLKETAKQLKTQVDHMNEVNTTQGTEIRNLLKNNAQLQRRVQDLQDEVDDMWCVIS